MSTVISKDGTHIAYEKHGSGPAVVLVDGALCWRESGPARPLAERLATAGRTVYVYDRRGRGESGDQASYDVQREIEDLEAVLAEAGGAEACLYGISSGAKLALEAVNRGAAVEKLALYECPMIVDDSRKPFPADYGEHLRSLIKDGRRGQAVKYFMRDGVGLPAAMVALFPLMPAWSKLKRVAHTLAYDEAVMDGTGYGEPIAPDRYAAVDVPTLVMGGGKSPQWIKNAATALAQAVPGAQYRELPGQTHMVKPDVIGPVLADFFSA